MKKLFQTLIGFFKNPKKYILTLVLGVLVVIMGWYSFQGRNRREHLDYAQCLDKEAVCVDGQSYSFRETAFYVAYEEKEVQEQAKVYDYEHPDKYWNLHIDGQFIRIAAREAAVQMAVHDMLFYQMALEEGITLSEDDRITLKNYQEDFWADLTDYDKQYRLGVEKEDIMATMEKIALAQKYQAIYAGLTNQDIEDYDFSSDCYTELLKEHKYKINEKLWDRISFGNVTI